VGKGDYIVPIPARLAKDSSLTSDARMLRVLIGAYADGRTGGTYVTGKILQENLGWGRRRREKAQAELCKAGWLRLGWKRGAHAVYARRLYFVCDPASTVAQFERCGEKEQLISYHSQSQVRSSNTTFLTTTNKKRPNQIQRAT
jgi:hypothetical protein